MWTDEEAYLVAQLGYELAMQGRYKEALILFDGLIAAQPANLYARRALAAVHLRLGEGAEALAALDGGGLASRDVPARRLRLASLLQLGWQREAGEEFATLRARLEPADARRFALMLDSTQSMLDSKQLPERHSDN